MIVKSLAGGMAVKRVEELTGKQKWAAGAKSQPVGGFKGGR